MLIATKRLRSVSVGKETQSNECDRKMLPLKFVSHMVMEALCELMVMFFEFGKLRTFHGHMKGGYSWLFQTTKGIYHRIIWRTGTTLAS